MALPGIDVGTTGCQTSSFSGGGQLIASAYEERDIQRPESGLASLYSVTPGRGSRE